MTKSAQNNIISTSKLKNVIIHTDLSLQGSRKVFIGILMYAQKNCNWLIHRIPLEYTMSLNNKNSSSFLWDLKPDGIIMNCGNFPSDIYKLGIPIIAGPNVREVPQNAYRIADDSRAVANIAADYFISRRFKNFAYCGINHKWSVDRGKLFIEKLKEHGFDVSALEPLDCIWKERLDNTIQWLRTLKLPTAVFTCNDDKAEEIIVACRIAGLKVPEEIAVLGVDNDKIVCETTSPKISSITFNRQIAANIAKMLDDLMNEREIKHKTIYNAPSHVVTRQSSDVIAIKDISVVNALKFIHSNCNKLIQVNDIAYAVGISERELRRRFDKTLNRSIQDEIIRAKIETISTMLAETNLTVSQIAAQLGYPAESKYISRFFKKATGLTPREYKNHRGKTVLDSNR